MEDTFTPEATDMILGHMRQESIDDVGQYRESTLAEIISEYHLPDTYTIEDAIGYLEQSTCVLGVTSSDTVVFMRGF